MGDYVLIRFKCECGFTFNQKDGDGRKFDMIRRMHKKKCDKYVDNPVTYNTMKKKWAESIQDKDIIREMNLFKV